MLTDEIVEVVRGETGLSVEIPPDEDLYNEVGVSSVDSVKILLALETKYGIAINDRQFAESRTVNKLAVLLYNALRA
jgi:acyl carrier protein